MKYAKLLDGKPVYAPNPILHNGVWIGNPPPEVYLTEGYKPVRYIDPPSVDPGYVAVEMWQETKEEIVQTWAVEPEPDEIPEDRAYRIITGEEK